jgi:cytochrome oxidase Cu insertion factor (SCO1/SenC/PrrC family)
MRTSMMPMVFAALVGCSAPSDKDEDDGDAAGDSGDVGSDTDTDTDGGDANDVDPDALNGTVPDEPLPAPEFAATNRDGAARAREDLLGHPTVMWFYPAAATAG